MSLSTELQSQIESTIAAHRVVLFMKGTRRQPQCGFSAAVVGILDNLVADYGTVNVLDDPGVREGIKAYSQWPTIPQLYVDREFVGGCDVVQQMYASGALHRMFGLEPPDRSPPPITVSDRCAEAVREVLADQPGIAVHLKIDADWNHEFSLAPRQGHEIVAAANGVEICFDVDSAQRARGLKLDMVDTEDGPAFAIDNPNAPPPVPQMSVEELKGKLDAGAELHLFDVRETHERERARIEGSRLLDEDAVRFIDSLPRDSLLVFHCHTGMRSQAAAEYFQRQGYTNVHNLAGGIEAWSLRIDPDVPRY